MNERIQELANQAFDTAEYPADQQYRIEPNSAFCKKFAELIVRECANYITEYYPHSRYEAFYMKKHFGVK